MDPVPVTPFYDSGGTVIRLGKKIGSGGEGDVYELLMSPKTIVAKIYKKPLDEKKQEKLRLMARGCNEDLKGISAWPTDVLSTRPGGPVVGFLMPKIADAEPIHKVYGPTHRKETFPHADWRFLVRAAKNLAAAFYVIHQYGYVIGDVNEGNILVNERACVRLIDCDSFQVRSRDQLYCCEVGVAQFTPPEIQKSGHFRLERTGNHDNFGLAILIFQLLFLGRHPYAGVYSGKEDMPIGKAIAEFRFAYSKHAHTKAIAPPPNSVGLAIVPGELADLFERAFAERGTSPVGRPRAGDWWDILDPLENKLRRCSADSVHHYYAGLSSCPWCRLEEESGVLLFLSADSITKIDLKREWQKLEAIRPPGPIPVITPDIYHPRPSQLTRDLERSLDLRKFRRIAGAGLALGGLLMLVASEFNPDIMTSLEILFLFVSAIALFAFPGKEAKERKRRKAALETAEYMGKLWNRKWTDEAGEETFRSQLGRLRDLRQKYEEIDRQYRSGLAGLESSVRERQLQQFLARHRVTAGTPPHTGAARLTVLQSAGILTAADVTLARLRRVPRLDNSQTGGLIAWRESVEKAFLFDPGRGVENTDVRALVHKYQPLMKPVERELVQGIGRLSRIQQDVLKKRVMLRPVVEKKAQELAQARADYRIFANSMGDAVWRDIDALLTRLLSR
ncbi:helix-hairpin-helix domain-containing protein [Methanoregula sp.]|jgi:DNA-binding helix-hairpin-helix protein with protein kinase domain|uniref:helix-hairpin-helix domain-containing protein n=1 Tax=Methanoregula sp. TaxID=2052170 RepID=UPI003C1592B5